MLRPLAFATCLIGLALFAQPAAAQSSPSAAEIINRLKDGGTIPSPARRTRGLSAPGAAPQHAPVTAATPPQPSSAEKQAVDRLFSKSSRGLSSGDRKAAAAIAEVRPTIDLTIYFNYNSAEITPQAERTLIELGKALTSSELANARFLVAGHTDAKGSVGYNQALSERRAEAIRRYLMDRFGVGEARLLAMGFGEEQLKNTADPNSGDNRRVQVVNFGR